MNTTTKVASYEIHQTKKPFNKLCALVIEYAILMSIPFTDESKDVNNLQDFHKKLKGYYDDMAKPPRSKMTPVQIELNEKLGVIWITRPMKCESAYCTIKEQSDERPGQEDSV